MFFFTVCVFSFDVLSVDRYAKKANRAKRIIGFTGSEIKIMKEMADHQNTQPIFIVKSSKSIVHPSDKCAIAFHQKRRKFCGIFKYSLYE